MNTKDETSNTVSSDMPLKHGAGSPKHTLNDAIIDQEKRLSNMRQMQELQDAAQPLVAFLKKYYNPHCRVIVETDHVEVVSGEMSINFSI